MRHNASAPESSFTSSHFNPPHFVPPRLRLSRLLSFQSLSSHFIPALVISSRAVPSYPILFHLCFWNHKFHLFSWHLSYWDASHPMTSLHILSDCIKIISHIVPSLFQQTHTSSSHVKVSHVNSSCLIPTNVISPQNVSSHFVKYQPSHPLVFRHCVTRY